MADIIKMYGECDGEPPLECNQSGSFTFFLFPDNTADCATCDTEYKLTQRGPMFLQKTK